MGRAASLHDLERAPAGSVAPYRSVEQKACRATGPQCRYRGRRDQRSLLSCLQEVTRDALVAQEQDIPAQRDPARLGSAGCEWSRAGAARNTRRTRITNASGNDAQPIDFSGVPRGIRTPVTAVKGRCPRPLDDGDVMQQPRRRQDDVRRSGRWWR